MTGDIARMDRHVDRWWRWYGLALFLLVPLDLLTTLIAIDRYGLVVEANPIMRWLLSQGLIAVTVVNLVVVAAVIWLFHAAIGHIRAAEPARRRRLIRVVNVWVGLLVVAGVLLVGNNLRVLV